MIKTQEIEQIYKFVKFINKFKIIERYSRVEENGRRESDAEHTWYLCMLIWLFSSVNDQKIDLLKALKMGLVHDLVEIYAGDVWAFDPSGKRDIKKKNELKSARKLFSQLPVLLAKEFMELWVEYEAKRSKEAIFVWSLDKIHPRLQWVISKGDFTDDLPTDLEKAQFQQKQLVKSGSLVNQILSLIDQDKRIIKL